MVVMQEKKASQKCPDAVDKLRDQPPDSDQGKKPGDTTKRLMSFPKCRSVEVINNPTRPGSNHREVNCINYNNTIIIIIIIIKKK
jgi:hypothetical protein